MKIALGKAALKSTRWADSFTIHLLCSLFLDETKFSFSLLSLRRCLNMYKVKAPSRHTSRSATCLFSYSWTMKGSVSSWLSPAPPAKNTFASTSRSAITSESARRERSTASTARNHFTSKTSRLFYLEACQSWRTTSSLLIMCAKIKAPLFFSGTWWDLPQVPDDLWRLC